MTVPKSAYQIRRSGERKFFDHGWLKTYHTFSFASYYDPRFMGFRDLRVINEDRVDSGRGFPMHDHKDMEIISIVLEGELAHKDSMGNVSVLHANDVQAMSAGTGISHSEYNPSSTNPVHFLQIWILPDTEGIPPRYQSSQLPSSHNEWMLIASKNGKNRSLKIQQDIELFAISLDPGKQAEKKIPEERYGWLQVINGELEFNADTLRTGDAVAIESNTPVKIKANSASRVLFFDLN